MVYPPAVPGVKDVIDIHCHAHEGQQDALALAKFASECGMRGILYKTIGAISGEYRPTAHVNALRADLTKWADKSGVVPIECWAGYGIAMNNKSPSLEELQRNLAEGARGVWLPVFNHANTYHKVGAKTRWIDPSAGPNDHTSPMPWSEALKYGHYLLGENGRLKPFFEEAVRMVADHDVALFFGHATHAEQDALADLIHKLGFKRAVVDHPFSPFVDLGVEKMKEFTALGIYMNFTFDELSPLLGVDPKKMYEAVRAIGVDHVALSSDAGEPLFPHSVECMRLVRAHMEAFGLTEEELHKVCCENPARIVGHLPA